MIYVPICPGVRDKVILSAEKLPSHRGLTFESIYPANLLQAPGSGLRARRADGEDRESSPVAGSIFTSQVQPGPGWSSLESQESALCRRTRRSAAGCLGVPRSQMKLYERGEFPHEFPIGYPSCSNWLTLRHRKIATHAPVPCSQLITHTA